MVRRGSSVSVVRWLRARNPRNPSLILGRNKRVSFHKNFQTPSRAHPVSYSVGIHGSFSDGKTAGAWSQPLDTIPRLRMRGAVLLLHHMLSWRSWGQFDFYILEYPLSYGVPVRERYGSTLIPATREQHDQNCTQSH